METATESGKVRRRDIITDKITLPDPLKGRLFLSYEEFGSLIGVSGWTVRGWVRRGYVEATEFSPRFHMIHISQLDRYKAGKLMETRDK